MGIFESIMGQSSFKIWYFLAISLFINCNNLRDCYSQIPSSEISFHTNLMENINNRNNVFDYEDSSSPMFGLNDSNYCEEIWCQSQASPYGNYYDDLGFGASNGFWLEPPPDQILFIPPPPMPPSIQALLSSLGNDSLKDFIIGQDPIEGVRCNFCKMFLDPKKYSEEESIYQSPSSQDQDKTFVSLFYVLIVTLIIVTLSILFLLIKYKKLRIFSNHSCPIWSHASAINHHHHHKSASSTSTSPSDTCLSPVVNEKSPQSIIMDAPLASLGKKSTICTANGKYWKRIPQNAGGNMFFMEDRRTVLRSLGGSSTGISDHPYSDAASCTSSPVYAELDPAVANCQTPSMMRHHHQAASAQYGAPYAFGNTYSEIPESIRQGLSSQLFSGTDSSTYDNAAYLSTQPFLPSSSNNIHYNSRSLRRLAAQRSAALNANLASNGQHVNNQAAIPLLSNQQFTPYTQNSGVNFFTGARQLKKNSRIATTVNGDGRSTGPLSVNYYKYGNTMMQPARNNMNHYVMANESIVPIVSPMMMHQTTINDPESSNNDTSGSADVLMLGSYLQDTTSASGSSSGGTQSNIKYQEMPLIAQPNRSLSINSFSAQQGQNYRISETNSQNDLDSASSSCTSAGGASSSASSSSTSKRPLPPVPNGVSL